MSLLENFRASVLIFISINSEICPESISGLARLNLVQSLARINIFYRSNGIPAGVYPVSYYGTGMTRNEEALLLDSSKDFNKKTGELNPLFFILLENIKGLFQFYCRAGIFKLLFQFFRFNFCRLFFDNFRSRVNDIFRVL